MPGPTFEKLSPEDARKAADALISVMRKKSDIGEQCVFTWRGLLYIGSMQRIEACPGVVAINKTSRPINPQVIDALRASGSNFHSEMLVEGHIDFEGMHHFLGLVGGNRLRQMTKEQTAFMLRTPWRIVQR